MPLTGRDVWEAIVKAGLLSGPYDPKTNRHCATADVLAVTPHDHIELFNERSEPPTDDSSGSAVSFATKGTGLLQLRPSDRGLANW